jgi:hypothetical protein
MHMTSSSPGLTGRSGISETTEIDRYAAADENAPTEPVIGLANGETRWRGMTLLRVVKSKPSTGIRAQND